MPGWTKGSRTQRQCQDTIAWTEKTSSECKRITWLLGQDRRDNTLEATPGHDLLDRMNDAIMPPGKEDNELNDAIMPPGKDDNDEGQGQRDSRRLERPPKGGQRQHSDR